MAVDAAETPFFPVRHPDLGVARSQAGGRPTLEVPADRIVQTDLRGQVAAQAEFVLPLEPIGGESTTPRRTRRGPAWRGRGASRDFGADIRKSLTQPCAAALDSRRGRPDGRLYSGDDRAALPPPHRSDPPRRRWPRRCDEAARAGSAPARAGRARLRPHSERARRVEARGVVEAVDPALRQVVIDHDDIPGVMPAMSMSFDVGDSHLLEGLEPGQTIEFTLELNSRGMRVVAARVVAEAARRAARARSASTPRGQRSPAPSSASSTRTAGVSLASLRGKVLLLDFVYTHCPGPCPILTGTQSSAARAPARADRRGVLRLDLAPPRARHARGLSPLRQARGVDLATWSFLGGAPDAGGDVSRATASAPRPARTARSSTS